MNGTLNTGGAAPTGDGELDPRELDSGELDPREAAALITQADRQARRQFEANPTALWLVRAIVVFAAYGAIWASVRRQHPYNGPSSTAISLVYALMVIVILITLLARARATQGVSGRSLQFRRAYSAAIGVPYVAMYCFMAALLHAGASHAVVYGVYAAAAPLIVGGAAVAGIAAGRGSWYMLGAALAVVAIGVAGAFSGPVVGWLVAGAGLGGTLLVCAVLTGLRRRVK